MNEIARTFAMEIFKSHQVNYLRILAVTLEELELALKVLPFEYIKRSLV